MAGCPGKEGENRDVNAQAQVTGSSHCLREPEKDNSDNRVGQAARNEGSKMDEELREAIQRAAAVLKSYGAREVYVFGSAAAGKLHEGSDVDLAVSGMSPAVFFRAMSRAADALGRELDLIDLDHENAFTRYLREEGELHRVA